MVLVSALNITVWAYLAYYVLRSDFTAHPARWQINAMVSLSAVYVFVCAFRSVIPRGDLPRLSLFDVWYASIPVGRSAATVAEICFVIQWAIALHYLGRLTNERFSQIAAYVIVPLIVLAEAFSWYAVLTKNALFNAIENSIWGITFFLIIISLMRMRRGFNRMIRHVIDLVVLGLGAFIVFLVTIDVPMYIERWLAQDASMYMGLVEGLQHAWDPWLVSQDITHWAKEIPWMTLYFSLAVWSSLGLILVAILKDRLPGHMRDLNT